MNDDADSVRRLRGRSRFKIFIKVIQVYVREQESQVGTGL